MAAAAFLARYSGRTLVAYRHDLRGFFQWSAVVGLTVLAATRPHIELYRGWMEDRGLAASTIDRRLSTVCGYYRFAHIDGRIPSNPAQYVRRPKVQPSEGHGMDRGELDTFLFTAERFDHSRAALAVLLGLNGEPGWAPCTHICCAPGSSWRPWTRESLYAQCRSPLVTPIPARRPSMTAAERTSTATQRMSWSPSSPATDRQRARHFPARQGHRLRSECRCCTVAPTQSCER